MGKTLLILICIFSKSAIAQYKEGSFFLAKEYSKDQSLYNGKTFIMNEVLGKENNVIQFYLDPLAAANSGELTTLVYRCESKKKEGLVLGFYGARWNDAGTEYTSYGFKELPIKEANELLDRIEKEVENNIKFLEADLNNNNIYFSYNDFNILIYKSSTAFLKLRVYWSGFDSEWDISEFKKTKKRLAKKLK